MFFTITKLSYTSNKIKKMKSEDKKWKWINCAFYLDEPIEENEIQKALKDEFVKKDLFNIVEILLQADNNTT